MRNNMQTISLSIINNNVVSNSDLDDADLSDKIAISFMDDEDQYTMNENRDRLMSTIRTKNKRLRSLHK